MAPFILRAIRIVIRADSDPVRQALFAHLKQSHRSVRFVFALHELLGRTPASALLVSCYGLAFFMSIAPPRNRAARILTVARHANARRHVGRVASWLESGVCAAVSTRNPVRTGWSGMATLLRGSSRSSFVRALRIVRRVDRRHGFLVSCRVASAMAWYTRSRAILDAHRGDAVLVSSDSNPEELGFASARARSMCRRCSSRTPTRRRCRHHSISACRFSRAKRPYGPGAERDRSKERLSWRGWRGTQRRLMPGRFERPDPVIGLFTPKGVSWPKLVEIVADCRQHFRAREIVIRWHPSMLEEPRLAEWLADTSGIVDSARTADLTDVAQRCDWVIADENSGGIPSSSLVYRRSPSRISGCIREAVRTCMASRPKASCFRRSHPFARSARTPWPPSSPAVGRPGSSTSTRPIFVRRRRSGAKFGVPSGGCSSPNPQK